MKSNKYSYSNDAIEITWDQKRCIHAKECVHGFPSVFNISEKPWINPDKSTDIEKLKNVIEACPTGALQYHLKDTLQQEQPPSINKIALTENGPLFISGDIRIVDAEHEEIHNDTRVAMCRCGVSSNKPFCDNSHLHSEFRAHNSYNPERLELEPSKENGKPLQIKLVSNGAFVVEGNYEVHGAQNSITKTSKKMSFCRCGASSNKPFCDGSHKSIGFEA